MYFQVHQPLRVKRYRVFDIGEDPNYFNDRSETNLNNARIVKKVATKSYLPANAALLELLERHPDFKVSFSISGVALEQFRTFAPEVIESFRRLIDTGRVELLAETYYHSLAFFYSLADFERQVKQHRDLVRRLFGVRPRVFRNTELSYRNDLAHWAERAGYAGVLTEGWDYWLHGRSPNFLYRPPGTKKIKLFLKNYKLSDDMAFRFGERSWREWPLTAAKFAHWVSALNGAGEVINLFMDYETFGEHQWAETGIFDFLRALPTEIYKHPDNRFLTLSEAAALYPAREELDLPSIVTWADTERDLSAWTGNEMQTYALKTIYDLEPVVLETEDKKIIEAWRRLQTSDHFYYMCTKWFADGDVHAYFNPYASPYEAFISYINAVSDLKWRLEQGQYSQITVSPSRRKERMVKLEA